jgi:hypothetical protein
MLTCYFASETEKLATYLYLLAYVASFLVPLEDVHGLQKATVIVYVWITPPCNGQS